MADSSANRDSVAAQWPPLLGVGLPRRADSHDERRPRRTQYQQKPEFESHAARPSYQYCNCTKCVENPLQKSLDSLHARKRTVAYFYLEKIHLFTEKNVIYNKKPFFNSKSKGY